jgi:hypothetical protein
MWEVEMYNVQNPISAALSGMGQAGNTYRSMQPDIPAPGKTIGGALSSGMGALGTGAATSLALGATAAEGSTMAAMGALMGTGWGLGIAAALGVGMYLLSD